MTVIHICGQLMRLACELLYRDGIRSHANLTRARSTVLPLLHDQAISLTRQPARMPTASVNYNSVQLKCHQKRHRPTFGDQAISPFRQPAKMPFS